MNIGKIPIDAEEGDGKILINAEASGGNMAQNAEVSADKMLTFVSHFFWKKATCAAVLW